MIESLIAEGGICLIAIAVIVAEVAIFLVVAGRRPSISKAGLIANGLSGIGLLLALRSALTGDAWGLVALWLGLSFVAHIGDIAARLRR